MKNRFAKIFSAVCAVMALAVCAGGCDSNVDEKDDSGSQSAKAGFYFGQQSFSSGANARTALPVLQNIQDAYSEIALWKKSSTSKFDYEKVASYEKFSELSTTPKFFALTNGTYNFKVTAKIGGVDYEQERLNVNITSTPALLAFNALAPKDAASKGSIKISFAADTASTGEIAKVTAALDAGDEEELPLDTSKAGEASGVFEKTEVAAGAHEVVFYFKDAAGKTLATYPESAYVYAGLVSKSVINVTTSASALSGGDRAFTVYTVTYKANGGTGDDKTQTYNPTSKLLSFANASLAAPADKKFLCWNTKADGAGTIYNEGQVLALEANLTLYAQYLDWDSAKSAYKISTADELKLLFKTKNGLSGKAILQKSIVVGEWTPVAEYSGTFDGNNEALKVSVTATDAAFVKTLKGAIKNLTFEDSTFTGASSAAAFASTVESGASITNCVANTSVASASSSSGVAGGIAATVKSGGTVSGCKTTGGEVKATSTYSSAAAYAGGIAGSNAGTIAFTQTEGVTAAVSAPSSSSSYAGGVTGYNSGAITGSGSVKLARGSGGNFGNVMGGFKSGSTATHISVVNAEELRTNESYSVSANSTKTALTINLKRTGRILLEIDPRDGAIYGAVTEYQRSYDAKDGPYLGWGSGHVLDNAYGDADSGYLRPGTYYIRICNDNKLFTHTGYYSVTVE